MQGQGTLEEQLATIKGFQDEVAGYQPIIEECETANQAAQAEMVFENPHTNYTMDVSYLHITSHYMFIPHSLYPFTLSTPLSLPLPLSPPLPPPSHSPYRLFVPPGDNSITTSAGV